MKKARIRIRSGPLRTELGRRALSAPFSRLNPILVSIKPVLTQQRDLSLQGSVGDGVERLVHDAGS
jgi:hypothetical protein